MKNIHKYILLSVLAFALASCSEDEIVNGGGQAKPGEEVQFGLSLPDASSRTVYGPEKNDAFPIYWSEGDKVQIYSPDCPDGRNNAEYSVTPVANASYAEKITKTGTYGVQWGDKDAKFYSVYPSKDVSFAKNNAGDVTAKLNIASTQTANYILKDGVYHVADMNNVVMYAQTDAITAGETVNLQYNPFSTILEFEINATGTGSALVNSITLTAANNIVGDFTLTFDGDAPTVSEAGNNGKSITMNFGVKPELNATNKTMKVKMCLMPISSVTDINGWTVVTTVLENNVTKKYTKTLSSTSNMVAGKIHKVVLPSITITTPWTYNPTNWIPQLPDYKTIYLTELSIPGAWYAGAKTDDGYQSTQSITDLWNAGIRAFAVETRCTVTTYASYPMASPSNVVVSGTADNSSLVSYSVGTNSLKNASLNANENGNGNVYKEGDNNITVQKIIKDVVACVKQQATDSSRKPEFAVLVLSYSESGKSGMRYVDFGAWLQLIYDAYNSLTDDEKLYIYNGNIDANTVVEDVLNKVIIKVNVDANIAMKGYVKEKVALFFTDEKSFEYKNNLPALFSYTPFLTQLETGENANFSNPLFSKMHWMKWGDSTDYRTYFTTNSDDFLWCFSSANRTHVDGEGSFEIPTYAQRKLALEAMMNHSDDIYENSSHNVWFYFNAGGIEAVDRTTDTSGSGATTFATNMNDWLKGIIDLKTNGGTDANGNLVYSNPSPLGIVMFNQCTNSTYKGPEIVKAIIEMNNKFNLKHATAKAVSKANYDSTVDDGGNLIGLD